MFAESQRWQAYQVILPSPERNQEAIASKHDVTTLLSFNQKEIKFWLSKCTCRYTILRRRLNKTFSQHFPIHKNGIEKRNPLKKYEIAGNFIWCSTSRLCRRHLRENLRECLQVWHHQILILEANPKWKLWELWMRALWTSGNRWKDFSSEIMSSRFY